MNGSTFSAGSAFRSRRIAELDLPSGVSPSHGGGGAGGWRAGADLTYGVRMSTVGKGPRPSGKYMSTGTRTPSRIRTYTSGVERMNGTVQDRPDRKHHLGQGRPKKWATISVRVRNASTGPSKPCRPPLSTQTRSASSG